jgi:hypothetical protein
MRKSLRGSKDSRLCGVGKIPDVRAHGLPHASPIAAQPLNAMPMGPNTSHSRSTTTVYRRRELISYPHGPRSDDASRSYLNLAQRARALAIGQGVRPPIAADSSNYSPEHTPVVQNFSCVQLVRGQSCCHFGGSGVGVPGPNWPYFWSTVARISRTAFPSACSAITSRVMFRQRSHFPPWFVKVMRPSGKRSAT